MKKHLVPGLLLLMFGAAFAQGIYKWTDEQGKVHYGDKAHDQKNDQKLVIKDARSAPGKPASAAAVGKGAVPEAAGSQSAAAAPSAQQQCLAMARTMVDKKSTTPAEIRADSKSLLDLCPGMAYECVTYLERPAANRCDAVPMKPNGHITDNKTYRR